MKPEAAKAYRSVTARLNYLALDRPELLFAAKECSRAASAPTRGDLTRLKRVGRFLLHAPRARVLYEYTRTR